MTRLSVNINKIATLRNARGGNIPDVIKVALDCEQFGAEGITVHPRPDERHIRYSDVRQLRPLVTTEFNIEGNPQAKFLALLHEVKPTQATLVPDANDAITSNSGWDTVKNFDFLKNIVSELKADGIRISIFVDTNLKNIEYARLAGADRIEFYTEPYSANYLKNNELAVKPFVAAANYAREIELGINAGHDLSLENLAFLHKNIPFLDEVSIGHALIADALYFGLEKTIGLYKEQLK
ncbi:MAG: pyridoxine 5'-phosphate synthase [Paludibacter sp.]|nr:pyridoxine 5'-phosphate synthase [Paludibacter sp.]